MERISLEWKEGKVFLGLGESYCCWKITSGSDLFTLGIESLHLASFFVVFSKIFHTRIDLEFDVIIFR